MKMQALEVEMEALNEDGEPQPQPQQPQQQPNLVTQLCRPLRMYMELYPRVLCLAWAIHGLVAILCLCVLVKSMQRPPERNRLHHDYTKLDMHYNWKAAQMDHWCLFGGDDACSCDDFSDPVSREETEETSHWMEAHKANVRQIQVFLEQRGNPDVVFIGDDVVEGWNGFRNHRPTEDGKRIKKLFDKSFEVSDGADADGLALGIAGDSVRAFCACVCVCACVFTRQGIFIFFIIIQLLAATCPALLSLVYFSLHFHSLTRFIYT